MNIKLTCSAGYEILVCLPQAISLSTKSTLTKWIPSAPTPRSHSIQFIQPPKRGKLGESPHKVLKWKKENTERHVSARELIFLSSFTCSRHFIREGMQKRQCSSHPRARRAATRRHPQSHCRKYLHAHFKFLRASRAAPAATHSYSWLYDGCIMRERGKYCALGDDAIEFSLAEIMWMRLLM